MSVADGFERVAQRCEARGIPVIRVPGWRTRGHGTMRRVTALLEHHTATPASRSGDYPSLAIVRDGRSGLPGPLAQWGTGRSGTLLLIASGISYHSGAVWHTRWSNATAAGNEMEHPGDGSPWPAAQLDASIIHAAEMMREFGFPVADIPAHREAAKPAGRKPDPRGVDMVWFRAAVLEAYRNPGRRWIGAGGPAPSVPVPATTNILREGDRGVGVVALQTRLAALGYAPGPIDGIFGAQVAEAVRQLQGAANLERDAVVGPLTRGALERGVKAPTAAPRPTAPAAVPSAPPYPLPAGKVFGPEAGGPSTVSGYHSHRDDLKRWQLRMVERGWNINPDGLYGPRGAVKPQGETYRIALAFQTEKGLTRDGIIGPQTWAAAWTAPIS